MSAHPSYVRWISAGPVRVAWNIVRLPLIAFLLLLAPIVQTMCAGLMLLGLVVSIAIKISAAGPRFPFWHMIGISLAFGAFIVVYYAFIRLLSR